MTYLHPTEPSPLPSPSQGAPNLSVRLRSVLPIVLLLVTTMVSAHGTDGHGVIRILSVVDGSAAAAAGLRADDVLVALDGQEIAKHEDLRRVLDAHQPGDAVPIVVERDGEKVELELIFGGRPEGGVSIGIHMEMPAPDDAGSDEPHEGATRCHAWIDETYKVGSLVEELNLDLASDYETIRACVDRDARIMGTDRVVQYCDNVFKVHCSGVDLLTEIGEALVERCETGLAKSAGLDPRQDKAWKTCAQHQVFDRYSRDGEVSDEAACRAAWHECAKSAGEETSSSWPQWGGPNQDFRAPAQGLATSWPEGGPETLWSRTLGEGHSAIVVEGGRLYTHYSEGNEEAVVALDARTGTTIWEHRYEHGRRERHLRQFGDGPNATPLLVDGRLFAIGVAGKLRALRKSDGTLEWSRELWDEPLGGNELGFGYSSSPVAYAGLVIAAVGGQDAGLAAFDQADGSLKWTSAGFRNSYSSPRIMNVAGQDQLVVFMAEELIGLDPSSGELLWRYPHANQWKHNITVPAVAGGDTIFLSSPQAGARGLRLVADGEAMRVEELWSTRRVQFYHASTPQVGDWVYGSTGTSTAFLTAVNIRTGEIAWRERGFAKANCVEADGKLVILDENGMLYLATATPEELVVHEKVQLLDRYAWTVPTVVGTTLYVRDSEKILAVDLG